jgi:RNA polymerase sigma-70 factor, ECF subfamily
MEYDDFFRAEQPKMVVLALALTGVPEAARDLAQESMVKAYRAWPSVQQMDRPGAWLRRVTINASMSWHRSHRREAAAIARMGGDGSTVQPEREGQQFWAAVRALPDRQRAVVALYYLEDQSVAATAVALEMPEGTVKTNLRMARAALALALGVSDDWKGSE